MFNAVMIPIPKTPSPAAKRVQFLPKFAKFPVILSFCQVFAVFKEVEVASELEFMAAPLVADLTVLAPLAIGYGDFKIERVSVHYKHREQFPEKALFVTKSHYYNPNVLCKSSFYRHSGIKCMLAL
jgi:hypothetical protein